MIRRPLEYASLKTVLLHLDANIRFQISHRMPSMRNMEKGIPLKISHLKLDQSSTSVNGIDYNLGIYQDHSLWWIPERINRMNDEGFCFDFDEYGFLIPSGNGVILPGDVSFCREGGDVYSDDSDDENEGGDANGTPTLGELWFREELKICEKAQKIAKELKTKGIPIRKYLKSFKEEDEIRRKLECINNLDYNTACYRVNLVSYECRRNKTKPPFTYHIQLTIKEGEKKQIQKFEYNKKLFEATKQLNQVMFGARVFPIHVAHLELGDHDGIYRLPTGFRLRAHNVDADASTVAHRNFSRILDNLENLENLNTLRLSWMLFGRDMELADFQNKHVRNSKRLVIPVCSAREAQLLVQVIEELPNFEISIEPIDLNCPPEQYCELIQAWLIGDRKIGSSCWIQTETQELAREVLSMMETRNEEAKRTERSVTISTNGSKKLEVFYDLYPKNGNCCQRECECIMKMRIFED